jgi:signal transduction histidine kinase
MSFHDPTDPEALIQPDHKIEALKQEARDLACSVESDRQAMFAQSNARIEALEQKARDLAWFVETTRQRTLLESDRKTEALESKALDLANFVETLRNQTRLQTETEIEALGQKARDLALTVESVRTETRLQSEREIAALGQQARDLAASVESMREETLLQSDSEIAAMGKQARDLAVSVKTVREETLLQSDFEIEGLKTEARNLAFSVEKSRIRTLMQSDKVIRSLNAELEQRVLERTAQLEAANKELEFFSYSVSHDLRAPLRAIDGFSRIVLEDYSASLADPGQIVRTCLAEMQKEQEGRRLNIEITELPTCQADPTLLKQVWMNLLSNALKYTSKRHEARIEIGCRKEPKPSPNGLVSDGSELGTETVYFVRDNGAGFDMRYAHKLFGVFQRLHRAADYDGTGVGLAIVQRIINRHGGRVWGEAQLNQGATFSFTLV